MGLAHLLGIGFGRSNFGSDSSFNAMAVQSGECSRILKRHRYTDIRLIGEGSFGKAILVEAEDGSKLVCKMVNVGQCSQKETQDAVKEGRLLAAFRHPYIVQYHENFVDNGWLCILMAFCEGGDLTSRIEKARSNRQQIACNQPRATSYKQRAIFFYVMAPRAFSGSGA